MKYEVPKKEFMDWLMEALEKERFFDLATVDFSVPRKKEKDINNLYFYILEKSKEENLFSAKIFNPQLFFRYNGNYYLIHIKYEEFRSYVYLRFFFKIPPYYIDLQPDLYQEEKNELTCCILVYKGDRDLIITPETQEEFLIEAKTKYILEHKDELITRKWQNSGTDAEKIIAEKSIMIDSARLYQSPIEKTYLFRYYKYVCIGIVEKYSLEKFKKLIKKLNESPFK